MNSFEMAELKVGDVVGILPYSGVRTHVIEDCKVTKINGHGHVTVHHSNGKINWVFDKNGYDRASKWHGALIITNADAKKRNADQNTQQEVNGKMNALFDYLSGQKNGYGNYHLNDEVKQKLKEMVDAL